MISGYDPPPLPETHYLDNRIFTNETIFRQELKDIFERVWLFVCHESELAAPGDHPVNSVTRMVPQGEPHGISLAIVHR